ncbi:hypothetical protein YIM1640_22580 [Thermus oshimai]|jgi:hypothetical protein
MQRATLLSLLLGFSPVLAWAPSVDEELARLVVDGVYSRIPPVPTGVELDPLTVRILRGGEACLPFPQSQPLSAWISGQAEVVALLAEGARNDFRRAKPQEVLEKAKGFLPDGHLRVFLKIRGLEDLYLRGAYTLGVRLTLPSGEARYVRAYRTTHLDDWRKEDGRYTGTLVFYLDLSSALKEGLLKEEGPLEVIFLTESSEDCLYAFTVNLGAFK